MKMEEKHICRLCFAIADHKFDEIDEILADMLEVLLLELDWNIIQNPVICETCTSIVKRLFYFKSMCIRSEKLVASFVVNKIEAKFELNDMIYNKTDTELAVEANFRCRFCMNRIKDFVCIKMLMEEALYKKMLPVFMLEMDFSVVKNPIVCTTCKENLDCYFVLIGNLLDIENKMYMYHQNMGTNISHGIKSEDILHFLSSNHKKLTTSEDWDCSWESMKTEEILHMKDEVMNEDEYTHNQNNLVQSHISSESDMYTSTVSTSKATDSLKHKCTLCIYATKYKRSIMQHMLTHKDHSEVDMHKCPDCPYITKWRAHFQRHISAHKDPSEVETYKCEMCTYATKYKASLQRHAITHRDASEVQTYKCTQCSYEAMCKRYLKRHMLVHRYDSELKTYKCELCAYTAKHKSDVDQHKLTHKDASKAETYKCTQCVYETMCKRYLKSHMLVHKDASEVEMFKCGCCSYKTKYNRSLQQHVLIHKDSSEVEMYKCSHCLYETKWKRYLKSHMLVHKNVTDVKTNKYKLSTSSAEYNHYLQHTLSNEDVSEIYKCSICPYETKWQSHLKRHTISHKDASELEMYACGICDCQFKHKQNMKRHMLTHRDRAESEMYKCSVCIYQTKHQKNLRTHLLTHK